MALRHAGTILFFSALVVAAQQNPSSLAADQWLPDGAIYSVQVNHPDALLNLAANFKLPEMLAGNSSDPGFRMLVDTLGKRTGTDFTGLIRQLTGGGITYAVYPGGQSAWVFDAQNPMILDVLQMFVKTAAGTGAVTPASTKRPSMFYQEYPGSVAAWSLDGKQFFGRAGSRLVLASSGDTLKFLFTPRTTGSLSSSALFAKARHAAGADPAAWAFVNMKTINQYAPAKKSLANAELYDLILNGALKESLRQSNWVSMGLTMDGKKLRLHAAADGPVPATSNAAFSLPGETGILPNLTVPREIAAATLWRDLGKFYSLKDSLFPEKTSGGILAENFLEIFFTGRDLNQEVFSRFEPQVRLVVARQQYDPKIGTPIEQYPAAALILRVKPDGGSAEDFGIVLEEAWQKAVGLTNFTRGQSAEPGVLIDRESHGGVTFTFAAFAPNGEKDRTKLPTRFNYRPAIVRDGPYIILASTDGLAKDVIDAVNKEDSRTPAQKSAAHTVVEISSPGEIAALLDVNKTAMVRQSVLAGGRKPEEAARESAMRNALVNKFAGARISVAATGEGHQADLELDLK